MPDIVHFRKGTAPLPDHPCVRAAGRAAPPSVVRVGGRAPPSTTVG